MGGGRDLPVPEVDCRIGLYRSAEGEALALTPTSGTAYRWRTLDGRVGELHSANGVWTSTIGWTEKSDGKVANLGACGDERIELDQTVYTRVPLTVTDTSFERDGLTFSGRLLWPDGFTEAPLVIHTHGSEDWSAVRSGSMQYMLAAEGIASFVYDKRGTGKSEGEYTQDFHVLAADAVAALAEARRLAGDRASEVGILGASQGGWVAPLAASESDVDFVVVLYGLAVNALQEDRYEITQNLARAGWGEDEQAKGALLSEAAAAIMLSDFEDGYAEFNRLRKAYKKEPWYKDIQGEFTSVILPYPDFVLRVVGPMIDKGTSWEYEPVPVLSGLEAPQFWMIAADDSEAPPAETLSRLKLLQSEGRPIDVVVYPGADHGMVLSGTDHPELAQTAHVQDYYRQVAAWIKARDMKFAREAGASVTMATAAAPDAENKLPSDE